MPKASRYVLRNPRAVANPLRSVETFRPAAAVFGTTWRDGTWNQPKPAPAPVPAPAAGGGGYAYSTAWRDNPAGRLANAEAAVREARRMYVFARKAIGEANASHTRAVVMHGRVVMAASPFTPERRRERRSDAFRLFNKRLAQLRAAERRLADVRAALNLPAEG